MSVSCKLLENFAIRDTATCWEDRVRMLFPWGPAVDIILEPQTIMAIQPNPPNVPPPEIRV